MTKPWPPPLPPEKCGLKIELHPRVKLWPEKTFMDWCPQCQEWFPDKTHKCPGKAAPAIPVVIETPSPPVDTLIPASEFWPEGMSKECTWCAHCVLYPSARKSCTVSPGYSGLRTLSGCRRHKPGTFKIVDGYRDRVAAADGNREPRKRKTGDTDSY